MLIKKILSERKGETMKNIEKMTNPTYHTFTVLPEFGNTYDVILPIDEDENPTTVITDFITDNLINIQNWEIKKCTKERTITIPKKDINHYDMLLTMTGNQIYDKFGLKRDETITYTANFEDGYEVDIKLVICEDESKPYTEAVLFNNGSEVTCSEPEGDMLGDWELETDTTKFIIHIITE